MNTKSNEKHRKSKNHIQNERIKQLSDSNEELGSKKSSDDNMWLGRQASESRSSESLEKPFESRIEQQYYVIVLNRILKRLRVEEH